MLIDINNRVTTEIAVALGPGPRILKDQPRIVEGDW